MKVYTRQFCKSLLRNMTRIAFTGEALRGPGRTSRLGSLNINAGNSWSRCSWISPKWLCSCGQFLRRNFLIDDENKTNIGNVLAWSSREVTHYWFLTAFRHLCQTGKIVYLKRFCEVECSVSKRRVSIRPAGHVDESRAGVTLVSPASPTRRRSTEMENGEQLCGFVWNQDENTWLVKTVTLGSFGMISGLCLSPICSSLRPFMPLSCPLPLPNLLRKHDL